MKQATRLLSVLSLPLLVAGIHCSGSSREPLHGARAHRLAEGDPRSSGPAATAATGDYVLENGLVRFVIQDSTPSPWLIGTLGGHLVDAEKLSPDEPEAKGNATEFLKVAVPMIAFGIQDPTRISIESVAARDGADAAVVRVEGGVAPFGFVPPFVPLGRDVDLDVVTEYALSAGARHLDVTTHVANRGRSLGDNAWLMDLVLMGGQSSTFLPVGGDDAPDVAGPQAFFASRTSDAALGVTVPSGDLVATATISGFRPIVYATDPLPAEGIATYRRTWIPGRDLADVLGEVYRLRGVATGIIRGLVSDAAGAPAAGATISVTGHPSGLLVSEAITQDDASFEIALSPGLYDVAAKFGERVTSIATPVSVDGGNEVRVDLSLPGATILRATVRDPGGMPLPAEVDLAGPTSDRVLAPNGELEHEVEPGHYRLTAMRGPEYDLATVEVDVTGGATPPRVELVLERVVDTSGWIAADFHLHSMQSSDSTMLLDERVASLATSGLEWVVSSDHDQVVDYDPVLERLGLGPWVRATAGEEISTTYYGHFNLFPLPRTDARAAGGAIDWSFLEPGALFSRAAQASPLGVLQLNHPRMDRLGGYLETIGYDPRLGRATRSAEQAGFSKGAALPIDRFQAMEVFNDIDADHAALALADYQSFLDLGLRLAMTGNSDSHSRGRIAGFPRNYVRAASDDPARLDLGALVSAVHDAHVTVSGGLFLTVRLPDGSGPGDLARHGPGALPLHVSLQGAPWIDADGIEVLVNGLVAARIDVPATRRPLRYSNDVEITLQRDSWIVARAFGDAPLLPWKDRLPFAITNPIWVDVDGNGRFDAPGLPGTAPASRR